MSGYSKLFRIERCAGHEASLEPAEIGCHGRAASNVGDELFCYFLLIFFGVLSHHFCFEVRLRPPALRLSTIFIFYFW